MLPAIIYENPNSMKPQKWYVLLYHVSRSLTIPFDYLALTFTVHIGRYSALYHVLLWPTSSGGSVVVHAQAWTASVVKKTEELIHPTLSPKAAGNIWDWL